MTVESSSRDAFVAAIEAHANTGITYVPAAELMDDLAPGVRAQFADISLHEQGGEELVLSRLGSEERRLWTPAKSGCLVLGAQLLEVPESKGSGQEIVLTAVRFTPSWKLGRVGLWTTVAHRVAGNPFDVVPVGAPADLAWAANAVVGV